MQRYTPTEQDFDREAPGSAGKSGILLERTKTTRAGDYLECEIFPVVLTDHGNRAERRRKSREAMIRYNEERARRHLERLLNANFHPGDLLLHLTMGKTCDLGTMQRVVRNYIARLKYRARKSCTPCKYVYVIETTGEGERERHHIHMALSAEGNWISRDEAEKLWRHGLARADRAQRQERGLCGFARYITQRKETQRRLRRRSWGASKGLINPDAHATVSDRKFSRAACGRILRDIQSNARGEFEKRYPGYRLILDSVKVRYSDFLPGAYIYAMMVRERTACDA